MMSSKRRSAQSAGVGHRKAVSRRASTEFAGKPYVAKNGEFGDSGESMKSDASFCIISGIKSGNLHYLQVRGPTGNCWVELSKLVSPHEECKRIVALTGARLLTATAREEFLRAAQDFKQYAEGDILRRPGWNGDLYANAAGEVAGHAGDAVPPVTFEVNSKYRIRGTLSEWQDAMAPFAAVSPLLVFAIGAALTGPLLRLLPSSVDNPIVELFGASQSGKTSIAIAADSVFCGDASGTIGLGKTWDISLAKFNTHRHLRCDAMVFLDEAEAVTNPKARDELVMSVVMGGSGSVGRETAHTVDDGSLRQVIMSTSNTRLGAVIGGRNPASVSAALSRVLGIEVQSAKNAGVGIPAFQQAPAGYQDSQGASDGLKNLAATYNGSAAMTFAAYLSTHLTRDRAALIAKLVRTLNRNRAVFRLEHLDPRQQTMAALVCLALQVGRASGVIPKDWGSPRAVVRGVLTGEIAEPMSPADAAMNRILAFAAQHGQLMASLGDDVRRPVQVLLDESDPSQPLLVIDKAFLARNLSSCRADLSQLLRHNLLIVNRRSDGSPRKDLKARKSWSEFGFTRVSVIKITTDSVRFLKSKKSA